MRDKVYIRCCAILWPVKNGLYLSRPSLYIGDMNVSKLFKFRYPRTRKSGRAVCIADNAELLSVELHDVCLCVALKCHLHARFNLFVAIYSCFILN
jgi:hypothetical protein